MLSVLSGVTCELEVSSKVGDVGQHFSIFPDHLIREIALPISIVVDTKTVNWFMKYNLAAALNCSLLDNATRGR